MEILIIIIGLFVDLLAVNFWFGKIVKPKRSKIKPILFYLMYVVLGLMIGEVSENYLINFVVHVLLGLIILLYVNMTTWYTGIILSVVYTMFGALTEVIVVLPGILIYGEKSMEKFTVGIYYRVFWLVARILTLAIVRAIASWSVIKEEFNVKAKHIINILITLVASICIIVCIYLIIIDAPDMINMAIAVSVSLILINVCTYYSFEQIIQKEKLETEQKILNMELSSYQDRYTDVRDSYENMRVIKHDLKNFIHTIDNGNDDNIINSVKDKINEAFLVSDTGNIVIDSILYNKNEKIKDINGKLELDVNVPIELNMEPVDMMIILGNLLDNAIEAVRNTSDKNIKLEIRYDKPNMFIEISNRYKGILVEENGKFITTKLDIENHGIGIESIKKIADKYNGEVEFITENNLFDVKILLYGM